MGAPAADHASLRGGAQRSYRRILLYVTSHGVAELDRPASGLLLSGISAGLDLGFSVLLMSALLTAFAGVASPALVHVLLANLYAVGFIFVVVGRSELFTEHTTIAVFPVLMGRARLLALGRLWALVYVANLVGAVLVSGLIVLVGPRLITVEPAAFDQLALPMVGPSWWVIVMSAMLAGWLMGLMAWLVAAGRESISQIFVVWLVAASIGYVQLHHCIAGSVEVLCAVFAGELVSVLDFLRFLSLATLGNAIGGVVFVSALKYAHVRRPGVERSPEDLENDNQPTV